MDQIMKNIIIVVLSGIGMLISCHLSKTSNAAPDAEPQWMPWVIKYERGPCFGQCPVYEFYLLEDNSGLIEVKQNLLEPGWYHADLDQEAVHDILMDIEPRSWWKEDISGLPEIADLPSMSMIYKHKDGLRRFAVKGRISDPVSRVFQKVEHLVRESRWTITTMRPLVPDLPEPTDVIVQLRDGVDVQVWMKKYSTFGIKLKKRVAPHQQYFVVTKHPEMGSSNDFFQYLKLDDEVVDAQWDEELSPR